MSAPVIYSPSWRNTALLGTVGGGTETLLRSRGCSSCSFCLEALFSLFLRFVATNYSSICPFSFETLFSVFLRFVATNCSSICPFCFGALFSLFFGFVGSLNSLSYCIAPLFAIVGHTRTFLSGIYVNMTDL